MEYVRFVLKCVMAVISVVAGIFSIVKVNTLPKTAWALKKNYRMVSLYSASGILVDILFIAIILCMIPPGTYGTGWEFIIATLAFLAFLPFSVISSLRLQKRMSALKEEIVKKNRMDRFNCLYYCPIFKSAFFFLWVVFVLEVP